MVVEVADSEVWRCPAEDRRWSRNDVINNLFAKSSDDNYSAVPLLTSVWTRSTIALEGILAASRCALCLHNVMLVRGPSSYPRLYHFFLEHHGIRRYFWHITGIIHVHLYLRKPTSQFPSTRFGPLRLF